MRFQRRKLFRGATFGHFPSVDFPQRGQSKLAYNLQGIPKISHKFICVMNKNERKSNKEE